MLYFRDYQNRSKDIDNTTTHKNSSRGLSVVIITRDEEANIRDCLESVWWADEIIVVDSGSVDKTGEICGEFGVNFFVEPWNGFARQKNSAIEKATQNWILSLDADERITPELRNEINAILQNNNPKDGYFIARKNFFLGRWIKRCGWYPDYNLRLFQRGKGLFGIREVHEAVQLDGVTGRLTNPMEHHTYKSLEDFMATARSLFNTCGPGTVEGKENIRNSTYIVPPPLTFINMYVLRLGFIEGYYGFLLSVLYAFYTFLKYIKLRELQDSKT